MSSVFFRKEPSRAKRIARPALQIKQRLDCIPIIFLIDHISLNVRHYVTHADLNIWCLGGESLASRGWCRNPSESAGKKKKSFTPAGGKRQSSMHRGRRGAHLGRRCVASGREVCERRGEGEPSLDDGGGLTTCQDRQEQRHGHAPRIAHLLPALSSAWLCLWLLTAKSAIGAHFRCRPRYTSGTVYRLPSLPSPRLRRTPPGCPPPVLSLVCLRVGLSISGVVLDELSGNCGCILR